MILISKKSTKRIIKGIRYEAEYIHNNNPAEPGSVYLKGIGWYSAKNFTDTDGNPVPAVHTNRPYVPPMLQATELAAGDYLICTSESFKLFDKGGRYEIERIDTIRTQYGSRTKIKFKDIKRTIYFNPWLFRKMTVAELRANALNNFFNEQEEVIPEASNKEKMLMELLARSLLDRNRHHLSIMDWGIAQLSNKKVEKSDYNNLMEMQLKDILNILE